MSYGTSIALDQPFAEVLPLVRAALAEAGFGIVSEIDMQATFRNKLGVERGDMVILGACSPGHAFRALEADPSIGLLLPCNVVVRSDGDRTIVEAIDTSIMVELSEQPGMKEVADEVGAKLASALAALGPAH